MDSKWKQRYLNLAKEVASWSKDPSRKIGTVAIGDRGQVLSQGYNGFPRLINDTEERYSNREIKYKYVVHAEMNVIYNASMNGVSLRDSTMFIHGLPACSECAKGMIQVGCKHIVMPRIERAGNWKDSCELTLSLFEEAGVTWEFSE